ncbi:MAG TPA: hypothetical protein PKM50_00855 [Methanoregula sp.]|nr:hypothetical protein [Methanoregula sp.]
MFQDFCTRVARKLRRLGIARTVATRVSHMFYVYMIALCGLMGIIFEIPEELFEPVACAGVMGMDADARCEVSFLSANIAIRR